MTVPGPIPRFDHRLHGIGRVVIRGAGEMGSGVAWRLRRCGFDVICTETPHPTAVRRWVAFSEAVYEGSLTIEGITGQRAVAAQIAGLCAGGIIPVLVCPSAEEVVVLRPAVIVDAVMAKKNTGVRRGQAPRVIGLGPGFTAGDDVDYVIETNRGPDLGRCIRRGMAEPNTGIPGNLAGETARRVLRAPVTGTVKPLVDIGSTVRAGDPLARIAGAMVRSELDGILRGMLREGTVVNRGDKIGDVDPRADIDLCHRISDKALAIAGGVLEAILAS